MKWIRPSRRAQSRSGVASTARTRLALEEFETRVMPYSASGDAWPAPQMVTISFMPDGTQMSTNGTTAISSNLFSAFNAKFGSTATWQNAILSAAQAWAQQTNLNFSVVADNGTPSGGGAFEQGDPGMGDIRIGGYFFGNSVLASATMPPPVNNTSIAGDIAFNTGQNFRVGTTYDLYTVAAHEFGHALGLLHSNVVSSEMYPSYSGVKSSLSSDDIAGIRNIYSGNLPRSQDAFDAAASNNTLATATDITSYVDPLALTASLTGLDISSTSDADCYTVTAPLATTGSLTVNVQSLGFSMLSPKVTVYAADGATVLGTATGAGQKGASISVNLTNVVAGQQLYVKVQGADSSAFGTGAYGLTLNFGGAVAPTLALPSTSLAIGLVTTAGGGLADGNAVGDTFLNSVPTISGITPDTGASTVDGVTNATRISVYGMAPDETTVTVYQLTNGSQTLLGTTDADGHGNWRFALPTALAQGSYTFTATATDDNGIVSNQAQPFTAVIRTAAPGAPSISGFTPDSGVSSTDCITNVNTPTFWGKAAANSSVTLYANGRSVGSAMADGFGNWTAAVASALPDGTNVLAATATDLAGNVSAASTAFSMTVVTRIANPQILGVSPDTGASAQDGITGAQNIKLSGTAGANAAVQLFQNGQGVGAATADANGNWTFDYTKTTLAQGTYAFTAQAADVAGNVSQLSNAFAVTVLVGRPPAPTFTAFYESIDNNGNQWFYFGGTAAPSATVTVTVGGVALGTTAADGLGNWTYTYTPNAPLPSGVYLFGASVVDLAGNASAATSFPLSIGAQIPPAPTLVGSTQRGGKKGKSPSATPTFTGTAAAGSRVTIMDGTTVLGTTAANAQGAWTFTSPPLGKGDHSIMAFTTAANGVSTVLSQALHVQV